MLALPSNLQIELNSDLSLSLNSTLGDPDQTLVLSNSLPDFGMVASAESELQKGAVEALAVGGVEPLQQPAGTLHSDYSTINAENILNFPELDIEGVLRRTQPELTLGETSSLAIGNLLEECAERCALDQCHGHGICQSPECSCVCHEGFSGLFCEERVTVVSNFRLRPPPKPCPDGCGGHGVCLYNGTCSCDRGWAGFNCSIECLGGAANPCSGHGICNRTDGKCSCSEGYEGKACARKTPAQNVSEFRKTRLGGQAEVADVKSLMSSEANSPGIEHTSSDRKAAEPVDPERNPENSSSVDTAISSNSTTSVWSSDKFIKGVPIPVSKLSAFGDNHASFDLGAKTLGTNKEAKGENSLLKHDRDKYWISPCVLAKGVNWFAIELNEEVYVHTLALGTFEYYSSTIKHFQLLGQIKYPTDSWKVLGSFQALPDRQYQYFKLRKPLLAKYIKIRVLSHYGNEFYCTLSSVRVYGNTQWEEMARHFVVNEEFVEQAKRRLVDSPAETASVIHEKFEDSASNSPPAILAPASPEMKLSGNDVVTDHTESPTFSAAAGSVPDVNNTIAVDNSASPQFKSTVDDQHPDNSTTSEDSNATNTQTTTEVLATKNTSTRQVELHGVTNAQDGGIGIAAEVPASASNPIEHTFLPVSNNRVIPEAGPQLVVPSGAASDVDTAISHEFSSTAIGGTGAASLKEEFSKSPVDGFPGVEQAAAAVAAAAAAAASAAAAYLARASHVTDTKASGITNEVVSIAGGGETERLLSMPVVGEFNGELAAGSNGGRVSSALESPTGYSTLSTATHIMPSAAAAVGRSVSTGDGADLPFPAVTSTSGAGASGVITPEGSRGDGEGGVKVSWEGQLTSSSPKGSAANQEDSLNAGSVGHILGLGLSETQDDQPLLAAHQQPAGPKAAHAMVGPDAVSASVPEGPIIALAAPSITSTVAENQVTASGVATAAVETVPKDSRAQDCALDNTCSSGIVSMQDANSHLNFEIGAVAAGSSDEDLSSATIASLISGRAINAADSLTAEEIEASECQGNGGQNRTEAPRSAGSGLGVGIGGESPAVKAVPSGGDSPPEVLQLREASSSDTAIVSDGVTVRAEAGAEVVDVAGSGAGGDRAAFEPEADATAAASASPAPLSTESHLPTTASLVTSRSNGVAGPDEAARQREEDGEKAAAAAATAAAAAAMRRDAEEEGAGNARRADDEAQQKRRRPGTSCGDGLLMLASSLRLESLATFSARLSLLACLHTRYLNSFFYAIAVIMLRAPHHGGRGKYD